MARKQRTVVEVQCDRCTRTEERAEEKSEPIVAFTGQMLGLAVRFEDLCGPCYRTVKNHLEQIGKKLEGASPDRVAKGTNEANLETPPVKDEVQVMPTFEEIPPIRQR